MKHLIKDTTLADYLEGNLNRNERRLLKAQLADNGETEMLYHLQMAYDAGMKRHDDELIGKDLFDPECMHTAGIHTKMAADMAQPDKEK